MMYLLLLGIIFTIVLFVLGIHWIPLAIIASLYGYLYACLYSLVAEIQQESGRVTYRTEKA